MKLSSLETSNIFQEFNYCFYTSSLHKYCNV